MEEIKLNPTKRRCLVCKRGEVVEKLVNEFVDSGLPIDGPGSEQQYNWVSRGFYCQYCGVKYEHCNNLPEIMAYCDWGDHYVKPDDIIKSDQYDICKACSKSIRESLKNIKAKAINALAFYF